MKLGLNLYPDMLSPRDLQFARQVGATHIVAAVGEDTVPTRDGAWDYDDLRALRQRVNEQGLELEAIENFALRQWDHVLLDGPQRDKQIEGLKRTIANMGKAGIPVMGYYFSLAGCWGRVWGPYARGGGRAVAYIQEEAPPDTPLTVNELWGIERPDAPADVVPPLTEDELWDRLGRFLEELVPVAAEAGVRLAAHPDDPPVKVLRGQPRLITEADHFQRLLDLVPSHHNALEFCQGTVAEMANTDVLDAVRRYTSQGDIAYVHFRNVRGKVPHYEEVFVDEGDVDMIEALRIYVANGYDGVLVPDHTPFTACDASWHAGLAFALGYVRAALQAIGAPVR